jgi:hypothetical protein
VFIHNFDGSTPPTVGFVPFDGPANFPGTSQPAIPDPSENPASYIRSLGSTLSTHQRHRQYAILAASVSFHLPRVLPLSLFQRLLHQIARVEVPEHMTGQLWFNITAFFSIQGNVVFDVEVSASGYTVFHEPLDPCSNPCLNGLCPMTNSSIRITSNVKLSQADVHKIPRIAYGIPGLEANVKVLINSTSNPDVSVACVEAVLSNGKTVDQKGVGWATALVAGAALVASDVTSGLVHSNTAVHVASNALSLFGYFQAQAIVGMTAVPLPPIVQSWTQNFDWSLGIIEIDFMQSIATWYQKSTGGTPATLLNTLTTTSVQVQKRSLHIMAK